MKATVKNALEIKGCGGAVMASNWISGTGRFASRRGMPICCAEVAVDRVDTALKGETKATAKRIIRKHPRCKKLICLTDRRALNAIAR